MTFLWIFCYLLGSLLAEFEDIRLFDLVPEPIFTGPEFEENNVTLSFNYDDIGENAETTGEWSISEINRPYRHFLFQGDLAISKAFLQEIVKASARGKRQAYRDGNYPKTIWTEQIPYSIHPKMPWKTRRVIQQAIKFWQTETCVRFKKAIPEKNTSHLFFTHKDIGCWSTIGRDWHMNRQVVNVGTGCAQFGIVTHEIAHALGIFHEQSRYDRDDFVDIMENRIVEGQKLNFIKISPNFLSTYELPYDLGSVMHYAPYEFAKNRKHSTMLPKNFLFTATLGQIDGPSFKDVLLVNRHYNCLETCGSNEISCQNLGYLDPNNCSNCKCPSSFGGKFCQKIAKSSSEICGGTLQASQSLQALMLEFKRKKSISKKRECVYHLKAKKNEKLLLAMKVLSGKCIQGCRFNRILIKHQMDSIASGFRLCCPEKNEIRFLTEQNLATIEFSSDFTHFQGILVYQSVPSNQTSSKQRIEFNQEKFERIQEFDKSQRIQITHIIGDTKKEE